MGENNYHISFYQFQGSISRTLPQTLYFFNQKMDLLCNKSQIANQRGAMAMDALRHRPTPKAMTRERSSQTTFGKTLIQGMK